MEPRFIHKSSVGLSQRQLAALFTDKVESRICARPFVRKPRAPHSIRSHSRNKMLEPAIIEASMNLNIEHILSEKKHLYFTITQNWYHLIFIWLFFPNLKQIMLICKYAKYGVRKRDNFQLLFLRNIENNQAFFCVRLS